MASTESPPRLATAADLQALPDKPAAEVIGGAIVYKPSPSFEHGDAQGGLVAFLRRFFHHGGRGDGPGGWWIGTEIDVELEDHQVYRPDIVGWRRSSVPARPKGRPVRVRPDWVCEVLSFSNPQDDLVGKLRVYQRSGVPHYWIANPEGAVLTTHRWQAEG